MHSYSDTYSFSFSLSEGGTVFTNYGQGCGLFVHSFGSGICFP